MRVPNSLDSDQVWCFFRPDLDPNCLQKLSPDATSMQRVNISSERRKLTLCQLGKFGCLIVVY